MKTIFYHSLLTFTLISIANTHTQSKFNFKKAERQIKNLTEKLQKELVKAQSQDVSTYIQEQASTHMQQLWDIALNLLILNEKKDKAKLKKDTLLNQIRVAEINYLKTFFKRVWSSSPSGPWQQ